MDHFELFYEPRKAVCENTEAKDWIEMSEFESAFLCGLLKMQKPKKILEVGVAAGGTTAIILQCLDMVGQKEVREMYSVDLEENFYRDTSKQSGFAAETVKDQTASSVCHTFLLGDVLPGSLDAIGKDIDFVVLDTMHILPGELLDFLAVLPYLTADACIVLHDIAASHLWGDSQTFATQLLFDVVTADKMIINDNESKYGYPNIGAFTVNQDTRKYIRDCFHALSLAWSYMPTDGQILKYRACYDAHYDSSCLSIFDMVVGMQKHVPGWSPQMCGQQYRMGMPALFTEAGNAVRYFEYGICGIEKDFAWSFGKKAKACFVFGDLDGRNASLLVNIKFQYIFDKKQRVRVTCKGEEVFCRCLHGRDKAVSFTIPGRCVADNQVELEFEFPDACSPAEKGISDDERILAVGFSEIVISL